MTIPFAASADATLLVEIGLVLLMLAAAARLADRMELSPIPLYLIAGVILGNVVGDPQAFSDEIIDAGSQIGIVLLLFMLGLEYSGDDLKTTLRSSANPAVFDAVLNFLPGLALGLAIGWDLTAAVLLGGVTYISSSGVIAKLLSDLNRVGNRETPALLGILVMEDLVMALYLPLVTVMIAGDGVGGGIDLILIALSASVFALVVAIRFGPQISSALHHRSDEVLLFTALGVAVVVAGAAEAAQVSAAVGAFLAGIVFSGALAERSGELLAPLRDLFAAIFFTFFGAQIDLAAVPPVLHLAVLLAIVTALTKLATGWYAASRAGVAARGRARAGTALVARGEFSIVIAGIGVSAGVEPQLGPLVAPYVLITALAASIITRWSDQLGDFASSVVRSRSAPREADALIMRGDQ